MVTFRFIKVGKPAFAEYEPLVSNYVARIGHFVNSESVILKDNDQRAVLSKIRELCGLGERIKTKAPPILICFDEHGKNLTSIEISSRVRTYIESSRDVCFLIGGPYGIDADILAKSTATWCLSKSTLTSDMAWLISTEQIYRALTILNNQPYHHA